MPLPPRKLDLDPSLLIAGRPQLPSTFGESVSAAVEDPRLRPTQEFGMFAEQQRLGGNPWFKRLSEATAKFATGTPMAEPEPLTPEQQELYTPERVKQEYGNLGLEYSAPTPRAVVEYDAKNKRADLRRQEIIENAPGGAAGAVVRFGAAFAGAAVDPLNIASAFIPVFGPAARANALRSTLAMKYGRHGARGIEGAAAGLAGAATVEPFTYGLTRQLQLDYSMGDALLNLTIGTALGGGLHVGGGALRDTLIRASVKRRVGRIDSMFTDAERKAFGDDIGALPDRTVEFRERLGNRAIRDAMASGLPDPRDTRAAFQPRATINASREALQGAHHAALAQTLNGQEVNVAPIFEADQALRAAAGRQAAANAPRAAAQSDSVSRSVPDASRTDLDRQVQATAQAVEQLMAAFKAVKARGRGRPPKDDPLAAPKEELGNAGITPDMSEAQARQQAEIVARSRAQGRGMLSREAKTQALAPHAESIKTMAIGRSDWDDFAADAMRSFEEDPPKERYTEVEAEEFDTAALELLERAMIEGREELEAVPEVEAIMRPRPEPKAPPKPAQPPKAPEAPKAAPEPEAPPKAPEGSVVPYSKAASDAIPAGPKVDEQGLPVPAGEFVYDLSKAAVDAERFQFKRGGDKFGVTDKLKKVKRFSRQAAGKPIMWEAADGTIYVVNGHQRVGLAKRTKAADPKADTTTVVSLYRERDGITSEIAMAIGAAANIRGASGNVIDMAKVARAFPELMAEATRVSDDKQRMVGELAQLTDDSFGLVYNEVVPYQYAAIVGRFLADDPLRQKAAMDLLAKAEPASKEQAESLIRQVASEEVEVEQVASLFGDEQIATSLVIEKSKVMAAAEKMVRQDAKIFGALMKESGRIEAAGNVLAKEANEARAAAAGEILQTIKALAYRKGPISDALTQAARQIKEGVAPRTAARAFIEAIRGSDALRDQGGVSGRGRGSDGGIERQGGSDGTPRIGDTAEDVPADFMAELGEFGPADTDFEFSFHRSDTNVAAFLHTGKGPDKKQVASITLGRRSKWRADPGTWEVSGVLVGDDFQRKGIASRLYDRIEQELGIKMRPSGELTPDGYAFWKKRDPEAVRDHVQWGEGSWLSPRGIADMISEIEFELGEMPTNSPREAKALKAISELRALQARARAGTPGFGPEGRPIIGEEPEGVAPADLMAELGEAAKADAALEAQIDEIANILAGHAEKAPATKTGTGPTTAPAASFTGSTGPFLDKWEKALGLNTAKSVALDEAVEDAVQGYGKGSMYDWREGIAKNLESMGIKIGATEWASFIQELEALAASGKKAPDAVTAEANAFGVWKASMADKYGLSPTAESGLGKVVEEYQQGMWPTGEALAAHIEKYLGPKAAYKSLAGEIINQFGSPAPAKDALSPLQQLTKGEAELKGLSAEKIWLSSDGAGRVYRFLYHDGSTAPAEGYHVFVYPSEVAHADSSGGKKIGTVFATLGEAQLAAESHAKAVNPAGWPAGTESWAAPAKQTSPPPAPLEVRQAMERGQVSTDRFKKDEAKRRALYGDDADKFPTVELEQARQARRKAMGYTVLAFRGGGASGHPHAAFGMLPRAEGKPGAVFFAAKPSIANRYASVGAATLYPVWLRTKGFLELDWKAKFGADNYTTARMNTLIDEARKDGYPGIIARNMQDVGGNQTQFIVLDGSAIRGWFARFDPEEAHSADFMAEIGDVRTKEGFISRDPMLVGAERRAQQPRSDAAMRPTQDEIRPDRPHTETVNLAASIIRRLPPEIAVKLDAKLGSQGGRAIVGGYSSAMKTLYLTARSLDPVATLRHEEIHALRDLGLFTPEEWAVLEARAERLRAEFGIDEKYRGWLERRWPDDPERVEAALREEGVAHMVAAYQGGARFGTAIDKVLQAIVDFFDRLRNAAKGMGFQTFDDVIRRIEAGEVAERSRLHVEGKAEDVPFDLAASLKDPTPEQKVLLEMLERDAPVDEIQAHPLIQSYIRQAQSIPDRTLEPGYRGPNGEIPSAEFQARAEYMFGGERVVGWDNAVSRLTDGAKAYAQGPIRTERRAVILLGPPAAGKSSIAEMIAPRLGAAIPDPDDAKKVIPGFAEGIGSSSVHEESGHLAGFVMSDLMHEGANMVIPKVGASEGSIKGLTDSLHKNGYRVEIVLMEVDDAEAFRRSIRRFVHNGRLIDPKYMVEVVGGNPRKVHAKLKGEAYAEAFAEIDNNGGIDAPKQITGEALAEFSEPGLRGQAGPRYLRRDSGEGRAARPEAQDLKAALGDEVPPEIAAEITPWGDQLVIPGAEKEAPKKTMERKTEGAKKAKAPQKDTDGLPLFSDQQADLLELMRLQRSDANVQKALDLEPGLFGMATCMSRRG